MCILASTSKHPPLSIPIPLRFLLWVQYARRPSLCTLHNLCLPLPILHSAPCTLLFLLHLNYWIKNTDTWPTLRKDGVRVPPARMIKTIGPTLHPSAKILPALTVARLPTMYPTSRVLETVGGRPRPRLALRQRYKIFPNQHPSSRHQITVHHSYPNPWIRGRICRHWGRVLTWCATP